MDKFKLGIIGYGNMATAILNGILKADIIPKNAIIVTDIDRSKLSELNEKGICTAADNQFIFDNSQYILLAVKPQIFDNLGESLNFSTKADAVISIMAGKKISTIKEKFVERPTVVRIMPNTPCLVGEGMSGLVFDDTSDRELIGFVKSVFDSIGKTVEISESEIDNISSISGSGPAYCYMFANAVIKAGTALGLDYDKAKLLTLQTIKGSLKMLENAESSEQIDELTERVCSKGGSTIEAVNYFKDHYFEGVIAAGIKKCKARNLELSKI